MLLSVLNSEVPYWMSGSIAQPFWTSIDGLLCSSKVTILWLRRFNTKQGNDRYLLRFIAQACKGMGAVVTLQDSRIRQSIGQLSVSALALGIALFIFLGCVFPPFIPLAVVAVLILLLIKRKLGYSHIKLVEGIRGADAPGMNRYDWWPTNRIFVIKSDDQTWKSLIEHMMKNVHVVVCDVTNPSSSLEWEIQTALKSFLPEAMLLACGLETVNVPRKLPYDIQAQLEQVLGIDTLKRMRIFFYPKNLVGGLLLRSRVETQLTEHLAALIAVGVLASSKSRGELEPGDLEEMKECDSIFALCPYCRMELPEGSNFCRRCELEISAERKVKPF
jgi:hypothetical protein